MAGQSRTRARKVAALYARNSPAASRQFARATPRQQGRIRALIAGMEREGTVRRARNCKTAVWWQGPIRMTKAVSEALGDSPYDGKNLGRLMLEHDARMNTTIWKGKTVITRVPWREPKGTLSIVTQCSLDGLRISSVVDLKVKE